jgi:hypothetical protein
MISRPKRKRAYRAEQGCQDIGYTILVEMDRGLFGLAQAWQRLSAG